MKKLATVWEAAEVVSRGGVVIYPTDTVYGIGCNPFDVEAVRRVIEIKKREAKPMPVLIADVEMLSLVAEPSDEELEAAFKLWPGPITILMKRNPDLPLLVTAGEETVGVRVPAHLIPLTIMKRANKPLIGTSANISGQPSAIELKQIDESVLTGADLAIDGGVTFHRAPSTVIKIIEGRFTVIREGAFSAKQVAERLGL